MKAVVDDLEKLGAAVCLTLSSTVLFMIENEKLLMRRGVIYTGRFITIMTRIPLHIYFWS